MSDINSWARKISSQKEIPVDFKDSFEAKISGDAVFPYTVFSPSTHWCNHRINEKLTCLFEDKVTIFEKTKNGIKEITFLMNKINYIQRRSILLHSWLSIHGVIDNKAVIAQIEYNTAVKELFKPIIKSLRIKAGCMEPSAQESNFEKLDPYSKLEYRFRHYVRECALNGAAALAMCFQPVIKEKKFHFFNKSVTNSHLSIITDKEWIYINEGELISAKSQKYEDIYTFIPLVRLKKVIINEYPDRLTIKLILDLNESIQLIFDLARRKEILSAVDDLSQKLIGCEIEVAGIMTGASLKKSS